MIRLTLRTSEAGILALRKLPCGVGRRYTGFAQTPLWRRKPVYRRHGMAGTRPGTRAAVPGTRSATRRRRRLVTNDERDGGDRWSNECGRRSVYNRRPPSFFSEHCEILRWRTLRKTLKRWWGRLEKRRLATKSGGTRRRRDRRSRGRDKRQDGAEGW